MSKRGHNATGLQGLARASGSMLWNSLQKVESKDE